MYPVSEAYKKAISASVRTDQTIVGEITLSDGETIIELSNSNIVLGSIRYSAMCSSNGISIGGVNAAQLELGLLTDLENPYSLVGARVTMSYGIYTGTSEEWDDCEYVPFGTFYVTEIERNTRYVSLTCLDSFIKLDVALDGVLTSGAPADIILSCCTKAGINFDTSNISSMPNYNLAITLPSDSEVETLRDCIMWVCQFLGCYARINRNNTLQLCHLYGTSVKTITPSERSGSTKVSDNYVKITQLTMTVDEKEYTSGTEGQVLELDENPFLVGESEDIIQSVLDAILAEVTLAEYTPMTCSTFGDPALMPGDYVTLTDTAALAGDPTCLITELTWSFRGTQELTAGGSMDGVRSDYSQTGKAIAAVKAAAEASRILAKAANDSAELINTTIGGNVLIRQVAGETNEILIMDSADPEKAVKIWRWNMGGLGYSDNCTGADNPAREYTVAITMDGTVSADFIKTGILTSQNSASWINMNTGAFSFGNGGLYYDGLNERLTIGSPDSTIKTVYTAGRISFQNNGDEVAYISGAENTLYIRYANIIESLRIGKFAWVPRNSGNLSLVKVGD